MLHRSVRWSRCFICNLAVWLGLCAGFALSVAAILEICSACSETAGYRILGMGFGWFGIAWFGVLILLQLLRRRFEWSGALLNLLLFASAGAELHLVWIQKYEIGQWCPICLSIAGVLAFTCIARAADRDPVGLQGVKMANFPRNLLVLGLFVLLGLGTSLVATRKEVQAAQPDLFLGKSSSQTTVYVISDWFCPVCRKIEPELERMIPALGKSVRLGFVDYPIHKETLNFTPYNLQFLAFEKEKYPALRKALAGLALKTRKPTENDVKAAVAPLGVTLREINYADTFSGMQSNMAIYRDYKIKSTPSVVVTNARTGKSKILTGEREIDEKAIRGAITEVEK